MKKGFFACGVNRPDHHGVPSVSSEGKLHGLLDYAVFVAGRG